MIYRDVNEPQTNPSKNQLIADLEIPQISERRIEQHCRRDDQDD
jgi:hypothetical protein